VRQVPVEQSEPLAQNRQRSLEPICGRQAKPFVEAWQEYPAGQVWPTVVQSCVQIFEVEPVGPSQTRPPVQVVLEVQLEPWPPVMPG